MSIVPLNLGSAPNDGAGQDLRSGGQVINANFAELDQRTATAQSTADGKVDKQVGKGLSTEDFTTGEKTKLAGLQPGHYRGTFITLAALQAGVAAPTAGDYADVDAGVGSDVQRYIWDATDSKWVLQGASGGGPDNTDSLPEGSTNRYFTAARVLGVALSGLSLLTGTAVLATDSVLVAFGKLQKQVTDLATAIADKANKGANSDITSLSGLTTPLSVAQGGNGGVIGLRLPGDNASSTTLINGNYATYQSWTGSPNPDSSPNNSGYLDHRCWFDGLYAVQTWLPISAAGSNGKPMRRWKYNGTWSAWEEIGGRAAAWGAIAGNLSDQTDLQASLNAKQSISTAPFTKVFESPQTVWTAGGLLTFAHGLVVMPKLVEIECIVTTAQGGTPVGARFTPTLIIAGGSYAGAQVDGRSEVYVTVRCGASMIRVLNAGSGDQITAANSRIILRAWA